MLAGIWVEIAKHTFSLDNLKYANILQRRKIILLLEAFAFVFAFVNATEWPGDFNVSFSRISNSFGAVSPLTLLSRP